MAFDDYATVQDVRDEGLPTSVADNSRVETLLLNANQLVEKITRNFFVSRSGSLVLDGNNSYILHLPFPVITVSALYLNGGADALNTDYYLVYNSRGGSELRDDRRNPKIELVNNPNQSIYTKLDYKRFYKGYRTTITGTFGYIESDDSTPSPIKRAVMSIVMLTAQKLYDQFLSSGSSSVIEAGALKREKTDDHELEWYQAAQDYKNYVLPNGIQNMLREYRAPTAMSVTTTRWYFDP